jgi:serine protease Do
LWLLLLGCAESPELSQPQPIRIEPKVQQGEVLPSRRGSTDSIPASSQQAAQPSVTAKRPLPVAVGQASSSVVRVMSYVTDEPGAVRTPRDLHPGYRVNGRGLGVIVKKGGFILTSYALLVQKEAETLAPLFHVQLLNDPKAVHHEATIIGVEPTLDLAVLRAPSAGNALPAAVEARDQIKPGSAVYAITGRAASLVHASGSLAGLASKECYQESLSATMLRADVELPLDTLGCPIFSASGKLIGLDTASSSFPHEPAEAADRDTHLLPIDLAFNIYEALETKRSMRSPWTGFSVRRLTSEEQKRFPVGRFAGGVALEYVWKNSPAQKLGLKTGDILVRFGHYPIRDVAAFQKWLYMHGVGYRVALYLLRGSKLIERNYAIEERPRWAAPR